VHREQDRYAPATSERAPQIGSSVSIRSDVRRAMEREHGVPATVAEGTHALRRRELSIIDPRQAGHEIVDHHVATRTIFSGATPSARRLRMPDSSVTKRRSQMASVSLRLISSGIVMSKERNPAFHVRHLHAIFFAVSAQAIVEFTSPTTTTQSGRSLLEDLLEGHHDLAVCSAWLPEPTSRW